MLLVRIFIISIVLSGIAGFFWYLNTEPSVKDNVVSDENETNDVESTENDLEAIGNKELAPKKDSLTPPDDESSKVVIEKNNKQVDLVVQKEKEHAPVPINYADFWVATDALGRKLPTYEDVGDLRPDKKVGVFYYIWVGNHTRKVFDISEIIKEPVDSKRKWGQINSFHFWGEPEYGYYHASDPFVIWKDMQMLVNAKVDFIYFDTTNAQTYNTTVLAVAKTISDMRKIGIPAPKLSFLTNSHSGRTMNKIYDFFYSKNLYPDTWYYRDGKPLILGHPDDEFLRPEVADFFTIKYSWAWTPAKRNPNHWQWLDHHPQDYGWSTDPKIADQIPVSPAQHPTTSIGKSFHNKTRPTVNRFHNTERTPEGLFFQEQWDWALAVDPEIVMVSQWNEWLAQRKIYTKEAVDKAAKSGKQLMFAGRPAEEGSSYFVDVYSAEFNRDLAPMKGGYTDNYYYQLIANIRKFKGMSKPIARPEMQTMIIDGFYDEWDSVPTRFLDSIGDTIHRDFEGTDKEQRYVNKTGRNDIVEAKVVHDTKNVCFYVTTKEKLTSHNDRAWMMLFIDKDQDASTGWAGYELVVNRVSGTSSSAKLERFENGRFVSIGEIPIRYSGNQLELSIPTRFFTAGKPGFDFKWADNIQHMDGVSAFFLDGDAAPDRRFNFRY